MKKLVLIMVFVLLMAVFIAFNYLLWDRQSKINDIKVLEDRNVNNSASVSAQARDIKRLENEISQYEAEISKLEEEKEQLTKRNLQLESDKTAEAQKTRYKIDLINILKQNSDIKLFEAPVSKWAEALNAGNYAEAYRLEFDKAPLQGKNLSLEEYESALKKNIKSLKLKEVLLDKEAGKDDGEIWVTVSVEVKLSEEYKKESVRYVEGLNELKIKLDYDLSLNEFYIVEILS